MRITQKTTMNFNIYNTTKKINIVLITKNHLTQKNMYKLKIKLRFEVLLVNGSIAAQSFNSLFIIFILFSNVLIMNC